VDGQIHARDVSLRYLPEMTPITGAELNATFDQGQWHIAVQGGRVGDLSVTEGDVYLRGLDSFAPATLEVDVGLGGRAAELVSNLRAPPVNLDELSPFDLDTVSGRASGRLRLMLTLDGPSDDLRFGAALRFSDLAVDGLPGDRRLSEFDGVMTVSGQGIALEGEGAIDGVTAQIVHDQDFFAVDGEAPGRTRLSLADVTPEEWAALGLPALPIGDVPVGLEASIDGFADGSARVDATVDVSAAEIAVAPLGFAKPADAPATLTAAFDLDTQGDTGAIELGLTADGLETNGVLRLAEDGAADRLVLDRVAIAGSVFALDVGFGPNGPNSLTIAGSVLDVSPVVSPLLDNLGDVLETGEPPADPDPPPAAPAQRVDVSLDVDRLVLTDRLTVGNALGDLTLYGSQVAAFSVLGSDAGGSHLAFEFRPEGTGLWLGVEAGDAGRLLSALDMTESVVGGTLRLAASAGRTGAVWTGGIELLDFTVSNVPAITRFIAGQSGGNPNSVLFSRAEGAFDLVGSELRIETVRAAGGQLGLSLQGLIDLAADRVDLSGTIVPVRSVNELVAGIPLIGDILTAGEGILAFTMQIDGPLGDPAVTVDPLSVLAPGIVREIFFQGGQG
jgi:hypothetical protein